MASSLSEHSTVVAVQSQVSSDLGGEVAILDLGSGMYYGLDEVGARVWELIGKPMVVQEVVGVILDEYDVGVEEGRGDVLALLRELADKGLVEVRDENPA